MPKYTIQDIFIKYGPEYIKNHNLSNDQWKVYNAIINCGTKELGYHICTCEECGEEIPEARRKALPGVRLCISCQEEFDRQHKATSLYNRRASKDSQLK